MTILVWALGVASLVVLGAGGARLVSCARGGVGGNQVPVMSGANAARLLSCRVSVVPVADGAVRTFQRGLVFSGFLRGLSGNLYLNESLFESDLRNCGWANLYLNRT